MFLLLVAVVRLNLACEPTSLDPRLAYDPASTTTALMVGEGLMRIDRTDEPSFALAKSVAISDDGLRYTFTLRKAFWSDKTPVTAGDFVRSWQQVVDPAFAAEWSYLLAGIRCSARDERTLVVELNKPNPNLLKLITAPPFLLYRSDAGCGPFCPKCWDHDRQLVVSRNPTFWDAENVRLSEIQMVFVDSERTELLMFEQGELDWAGAPNLVIPFDAVPLLRREGVLHTQPTQALYYYKFNTHHPLLSNIKIRRALASVIPRETLNERIAQGTHRIADGFLPDSIPNRLSIKEAQKLFTEGISELGLSEIPTLELSFNTTDDHLAFAQAIQHQWQRLFNLRVHLANSDWKVHLSRLAAGQFEVGRHMWTAQVDAPLDLLTPFLAGNDMGWDSPRFNALFEQRDAQAAEVILLEEMPAAPLFFLNYNYLHNPRLEGAFLSPLGRLDLRWAQLK